MKKKARECKAIALSTSPAHGFIAGCAYGGWEAEGFFLTGCDSDGDSNSWGIGNFEITYYDEIESLKQVIEQIKNEVYG